MRKIIYNMLEKPSTNKKARLIGDVWLAKVIYKELGCYYKPRPVLIIDIKDDKYYCLKITTNKNKGKEIELPNNKIHSIRKSYLTPFITILNEEDFYVKLKQNVDYKQYYDDNTIRRSNYGIYKNR